MLTVTINLPLHEPVYVFAILLLIILLAPIVFRIVKIPDIAAYLLAGIIIGPYGFHLLDRDGSIVLFGTIGLLYIMFIAGLELNLKDLNKNWDISIVFGLFTFIIPFVIGFTICNFLLHLNIIATILVSIMFSTHTLVAYPVARKLGIIKDNSVLAAVGGTIITDTLVLLVLSIITGISANEKIPREIIKLAILFIIYLLVIFISYPRIASWFFKNIERDQTVHYIFLLAMVLVSASLAKLIGIEPIIGAFIAGLALNKSVPRNSILLQYVDFVGNILFIPFFLISIGMLIDLHILFQGLHLWYIAALLVIAALFGKWLAAFLTQNIFGYSNVQRNVLFGLTSSHAAATIAVILIGYERNLIDGIIFNAVIVIILVTCLTATFVTEWSGRKLANERSKIQSSEQKLTRKILVPVSNPSTMSELINVAIQMNSYDGEEPVYAVSVVKDDTEAGSKLENIRECLEMDLARYNTLAEKIKLITRIDLSVTNGILLAAKELMITDIIIGWGKKSGALQKILGNIFDHLLKSSLTLYVCHVNNILQNFNQVKIYASKNTEVEPAFSSCMNHIIRLILKKETKITLYSNSESTIQTTTKLFHEKKYKNLHRYILSSSKFESQLYEEETDILNVLFLGRKQYVSYDPAYEKLITSYSLRQNTSNFIIVVPGQD